MNIESIIICVILLSTFINNTAHTQDENMHIEGAIQLSEASANPLAGTIRWSGNDIEGFTGQSWKSLTTTGTVRDASGYYYTPIAIGKQVWLRENLRTSKYQDGSDIPFYSSSTGWSTLNSGAYRTNKPIPYGNLYNWFVVADSRKVCPAGWRIPSGADYQELIDVLGGQNLSGPKLKEVHNFHWNNDNSSATDASGFKAMPASVIYASGNLGTTGNHAIFWTTTSPNSFDASAFQLAFNTNAAIFFDYDKHYGLSIRCIKE